jgi:hypothetical protein
LCTSAIITDSDFDKFGVDDGAIYWNACEGTYNTSIESSDCKDNNDQVNPGALETCDGADNDCSGGIDDGIGECNPGPAIEMQNTIGGEEGDGLYSLETTSDGGYILGGYSYSPVSFDKTEENFDEDRYTPDYWIVKVKSDLNIEWQNTIGGDSTDVLTCVKQTSDGGYIIGGYSESPISGDKTEGVLGPEADYYDYWILKLDDTGIILWQNTIGGSKTDELWSIEQTSDGGYILGGFSSSPVSGDKTEGNLWIVDYTYDYWVVKLNSLGFIEWQNTIGGSDGDSDWASRIEVKQTTDGGYILGGNSKSPVSGDKTEASLGSMDYWIIKLDDTIQAYNLAKYDWWVRL